MSPSIPREFTRVRIRFGVSVEPTVGSRTFQGESRDLSLNGLYVVAPAAPPIGEECRVRIALGETREVCVEAEGRVVRADDQGFAVAFVALDFDSYHHMQNLIRNNAVDPDRAEREFREHLGLKRAAPPAEP